MGSSYYNTHASGTGRQLELAIEIITDDEVDAATLR